MGFTIPTLNLPKFGTQNTGGGFPSLQDNLATVANYNAPQQTVLTDNANTLARQIALNSQDVLARTALNNVDAQSKKRQLELDRATIDARIGTANRQPALLDLIQQGRVAQHGGLDALLATQRTGATGRYGLATRGFTADTEEARRQAMMQGRDLRYETAANGALQTQGYGQHVGDINAQLAKQLTDLGIAHEGAGIDQTLALANLENQRLNNDVGFVTDTAQHNENLAGVTDTQKALFNQMLGINNSDEALTRATELQNALVANQGQSTAANLNQQLSSNGAQQLGLAGSQVIEAGNTGALPQVYPPQTQQLTPEQYWRNEYVKQLLWEYNAVGGDPAKFLQYVQWVDHGGGRVTPPANAPKVTPPRARIPVY